MEPLPSQNNSGSDNPQNEYMKVNPIEHALIRPDMYIGSVGSEVKTEYVMIFDNAGQFKLEVKDITTMEGLERMFLEILSNGADNAKKSREMGIAPGIIIVSVEADAVSIYNEGRPISCAWHDTEKMWIPELIFSQLMAGSSFNDSQDKKWAGRNGLGAKLVAIFSREMLVEIKNTKEGIFYKQTISNNLKNVSKAERVEIPKEGQSYTKITYKADLKRFYCPTNAELEHTERVVTNEFKARTRVAASPLTNDPKHCIACWDACHGNDNLELCRYSSDFIGLMARLCLDFAFNCNVPIHFKYENVNAKFDISSPLEFGKLYMPELANIQTHPIVYEDEDTRLAMFDTPYNGDFISFANGMPTRQGGVHVNGWINGITEKLKATLELETGIKLTVTDVRKHVTLFLSSYVINPKFDGQTKERLKGPHPKVTVSQEMFGIFSTWEAAQAIRENATTKKIKKVAKATDGSKDEYVKVPKADDAGWAGTKDKSHLTVAFLVEGDSAKTFWTRGLKYVKNARETMGCYPLRGKVLNTRKTDIDTELNNAVLNNIKKFLGLKLELDYSIEENLRKLRYGRVIILADADPDGTHIKGLLLSFFANYKGLVESGFVWARLTPIVICTKGPKKAKFYSSSEIAKWKKVTPDFAGWKTDYFKGLGSATPEMIEDAFKYAITQKFVCEGDDQDVLELAFGHKTVKARRELYRLLIKINPDERLDSRNISRVQDLIYDELITYAIMANERHIPRIEDGMKKVQRQVIFACLRSSIEGKKSKSVSSSKMWRVDEFSAHVMKVTRYAHGPESLNGTVIGMAADYPGANNINLLTGVGEFGSRMGCGKDAAAPRYLHCRPSSILRKIFREEDDILLKPIIEDGKVIGIETYQPVIPMQLINDCDGMGWGWSNSSVQYNPMSIIEFVRYYISFVKDGRPEPEFDPPVLVPWWRGYEGSLYRCKTGRYYNRGEFLDRGATCEIRELPVKTSAATYQTMLEAWQEKGKIRGFKAIGTDPNKPQFRIEGYADNFTNHRELRLERGVVTSNCVYMDPDKVPKWYNFGPLHVAVEFCKRRFETYVERKKLYTQKLIDELKIAQLKLQFVEDVIAKRIILADATDEYLLPIMKQKGYPLTFLDMKLRSITKKKADKIRKEVADIAARLEYYRRVYAGDLWLKDLEDLEAELNKLYPGQWKIAPGYGGPLPKDE
jgi:DNA topoisomerase-2